MTTITKKLADALRLADANATLSPCESAQVYAALSAYDAQQGATSAPGTWRVDDGGDGEIEIWTEGRGNGDLIATVENMEDAARIAQCVNAHDALVSALRNVRALQSFAEADGRGMQGDNAAELESIISGAFTAAGLAP